MTEKEEAPSWTVRDRFNEIVKGDRRVHSQTQYSLTEQLEVARLLCNYYGLYDAADFLRKRT